MKNNAIRKFGRNPKLDCDQIKRNIKIGTKIGTKIETKIEAKIETKIETKVKLIIVKE